MSRAVRFFFAFCLAWALAPAADAQPQPPTNPGASANPVNLSIAGLHVVGNQILNNLNQAVQLRGVDINGPDYWCIGGTPPPFDPASGAPNNNIPQMQAWGINVVRLALNEDCWLGINGMSISGSAYINPIVSYIEALNAANIAVIMDLQYAAPGSYQSACNTQPMPDSTNAPAFWASVASTPGIKNNGSVIFDLYNEPWPDGNNDSTVAWQCMQSGGLCNGNGNPVTYSCNGNTVQYTAASMQSLVSAIRAQGANNIIDVPGIQFTTMLDQWRTYEPTDTLNPAQLVAAWHSYSNEVCNTQSCWTSNILSILQSGTPVIAEEIGEADCEDVYVTPLMQWLDAHGGNYIAWAWNTYSCGGEPAVISNLNGTPTAYGVGIRNHLLAMNGEAVPVPPVIPFFTNTYPFGIAVGRATNYTSSNGTIYYGDQQTFTGMTTQFTNPYAFAPISTSATITGTSDPVLYQTGRYGVDGLWTINVPNGTYTVTFGVAPYTAFTQTQVDNPSTASPNNTGEYGQDQTLEGNDICCVWSNYPIGGPNSPYSNDPSAAYGTIATPAIDVVGTVPYTVNVYTQQLTIEIAASFGNNCNGTQCGNRQTMLNSILVAQGAPISVPPAPTGVTATPSSGQVALAWNAASTATYYIVLRATQTNGAYLPIEVLTTGATSYTDTTVTNGTTYYYYVEAANPSGTGQASAQVSATPNVQIPPVPTGLTASPGNATVTLNWGASTGATSYKVSRSTTNGSGYAQIATPSTNYYTDSSVTNGTTYYYVVAATDSVGTSANSSQVSATPSGSVQTGTWTNVTTSAMNIGGTYDGTQTIGADPAHPGTIYSPLDGVGLFKSTDYGQTWTGPINTGTCGAAVGAAGGSGITVGNNGIIYAGSIAIRGTSGATCSGITSPIGLFKSIDGGVDWVLENVTNSPGKALGVQDLYYPQIDPYNANHLIITGHESAWISESCDGGNTWASLNEPPPAPPAGTAFMYFVNTGTAGTPCTHASGGTANTWLWIAQGVGGQDGTWRTTTGGTSWTQVNSNEHGHGTSSMYQPYYANGSYSSAPGTIFMDGDYFQAVGGYSAGIIVSTDYGVTWNWAGSNTPFGSFGQNVIGGTPNFIYSNNGAAVNVGSLLTISTVPQNTSSWSQPSSAPNSSWGCGTGQFLPINNGTNWIILAANWGGNGLGCGTGGIWRYVEP